ncbi:MAG: response regulator transcription factor [Balneolaceae bacterium]
MTSIPILIADKFDISRSGIEAIIKQSNKASAIKSVRTADELLNAYAEDTEAVCIISSNITDTNIHQLMEKLYSYNENAAVMVISNSADLMYLNQSLKAGVNGYLTKNISSKKLIEAIESVHKGERVFSKSVSKLIVGKYADLAKKTGGTKKSAITKREKEILALIVDGYTSSQIAKILHISPRTVETHRSNLMHKLDIKNTAGLVRFAMEQSNLL